MCKLGKRRREQRSRTDQPAGDGATRPHMPFRRECRIADLPWAFRKSHGFEMEVGQKRVKMVDAEIRARSFGHVAPTRDLPQSHHHARLKLIHRINNAHPRTTQRESPDRLPPHPFPLLYTSLPLYVGMLKRFFRLMTRYVVYMRSGQIDGSDRVCCTKY